MKPVRVILVEDDSDWASAMLSFLEREGDLKLVGTAADRDSALALFSTVEAEVVLMDIQLGSGGLEGIRLAVDMSEIRPVKIIMLTSLEDEQVITRAFTAGAVNYVRKTDYRQLPAAIRSAVTDGSPMEILIREFGRLKREEQLAPLTAAEREVFELLEEGYTKPQIQRKLFKTESTIKNQMNKLLKKLGVRSGKEAVEKVKRKGL
ncbi:response regulator [Paenibacillus gansuensis]|uniref:Response regulator n=1 Tax=Paenibacillus gansuensis TaxID=306542 RepID=A0ABW5P833_9BACL